MQNADKDVVEDFGREWSAFDQSGVPVEQLRRDFAAYFAVFPWDRVPGSAVGFDCGCGSGRWDQFVAPRVAELHCIDASAAALGVARRNLAAFPSCRFHCASVDAMPLEDGSMDFGFSLGVLHHVPDTARGIAACAAKLKPGAPLLLYLYYAFDNRPGWFRALWKATDLLRRVLSRAPFWLKLGASQLIALIVYWPLARTARALAALGRDVDGFPLSLYRDKPFYYMRTDALDRFGTKLEKRFSKAQIEQMMRSAGLTDVRFSDAMPYWCAVGIKSQPRAT